MNAIRLNHPLLTVNHSKAQCFHQKHHQTASSSIKSSTSSVFDRTSSSPSLKSTSKRCSLGFVSGFQIPCLSCKGQEIAFPVRLYSLFHPIDCKWNPLSIVRTTKSRKLCRKHNDSAVSWHTDRISTVSASDRKCSKSHDQNAHINDTFSAMEKSNSREILLRQAVTSLVAAGLVLMSPSIQFTSGEFSATGSCAVAASANQLRQGGVFLEKIAGRFKSGRVLDKITTVISGQTTVDPKVIDKELKAITEGEDDIGESLKNELLNNLQDTWSTFIDVVSNFNPSRFSESAGASIEGLLGGATERFAAWELSTLVSLGERWLILTPIVLIPMAWQMSRYRNEQERTLRERQEDASMPSEEVNQRQLKVTRELERMELKASLLELIRPLGKNQSEIDSKKKRVNQIIERLQELNPSDDMGLANLVSKGSNEPFMYIQQKSNIDGTWQLSYVLQLSDENRKSQFPDIPGLEISNVRQRIWHGPLNEESLTSDDAPISTKFLARNTAEISLGLLGMMEVAIQGNWENSRDKPTALVSFDTFSIRPLNLMGTVVREDLPPLTIALPRTLQQSAEWETMYVDEEIRINKGREGNLYIFKKILCM